MSCVMLAYWRQIKKKKKIPFEMRRKRVQNIWIILWLYVPHSRVCVLVLCNKFYCAVVASVIERARSCEWKYNKNCNNIDHMECVHVIEMDALVDFSTWDRMQNNFLRIEEHFWLNCWLCNVSICFVNLCFTAIWTKDFYLLTQFGLLSLFYLFSDFVCFVKIWGDQNYPQKLYLLFNFSKTFIFTRILKIKSFINHTEISFVW